MKKLSVKLKLLFLSTFLLSLTGLVGLVQFFGNQMLMKKFTTVTDVDMPALQNMTLVDMMHDGLRSVVYRSIYLSENGTEESKKEAIDELDEFTENLTSYMSVIGKLDLKPQIKKAIEKSGLSIKSYVETSKEVVHLALSGRRSQAIAKLGEFEEAFQTLATDLEVLAGMIEKGSKQTYIDTQQAKTTVTWLSVLIFLFGILIGSVSSIVLVRRLSNTLGETIDNLSEASTAISVASRESALASTNLSESSTEQAASLQETMASVEQISAMVTQNAESSQKAKGAVESNQKASELGQKSVSDMLEAIDEIKDVNDKILGQMEMSNREFAEIVKIISEIGEKTKVINDIVFQTKLLSFNASVEAARAGEHGKGFAVVAEEVGNLAQMSGNASKQISDMLSSSIKKVDEIVEQTTRRVDQLVEVGKDRITMGQSTAQKCREALALIAESARTVGSMVAEIANASKEQAQGVQEINKAISQLDQVTQQNSAIARQSSTQSESLFAQSQSLASNVRDLVALVHGQPDTSASTNLSKPPVESKGNTDNVTLIRAIHERKSVKDESNKNQSSNKVKFAKAASMDVPSSDNKHFEDF